jgi:hypothetical protein
MAMLNIRLPDAIHRAFKAWCAHQGTSMQDVLVAQIGKLLAKKPDRKGTLGPEQSHGGPRRKANR